MTLKEIKKDKDIREMMALTITRIMYINPVQLPDDIIKDFLDLLDAGGFEIIKKSKMGTHRRKANRPSIKSKIKKIPGGLDWSNQDRNAGTLKRIEKAIEDENDIPVCRSQSIDEWEREHGHGFWGNETTGYIYDKDNK